MRYIIAVLAFTALTGCGVRKQSEFDRTAKALSVRPHVAQALRDYQANRGGNNEPRFELLHAFCKRRQMAAPREQYPELADPILDTNSVAVLLGQPYKITEGDTWLYFFNPEQDWHLELKFREGKLFHTSFRQLISADEMTENINTEHGTTNTNLNPISGSSIKLPEKG